MSTEASRQFKPNLVLVNRRKAAGWESRKRAARELHRLGLQRGLRETPTIEAIEKAMYRHETGRVAVTDPIYRQLYCLAYGAKPHDLFGELTGDAAERPHFTVRSHKFVPTYVGAEGVKDLRRALDFAAAEGQWHTCQATAIDHPEGECSLYVWPSGSVVFHLVEEVQMSTIAALAAWRKVSYGDNIRWAADLLCQLIGEVDQDSLYVLGAHWLTEPAWPPESLDAALRIMATPSVLLHRDRPMDDEHLAHAELIEQSLLSEQYDHARSSRSVSGASRADTPRGLGWCITLWHPSGPSPKPSWSHANWQSSRCGH